jgi:CrcB protein
MGGSFPFGTVTINVLGSFLISVVMTLSLRTGVPGPNVRLALTTGVLGGFTTYSSFNYETFALWQRGAFLFGALNIAVTVAGCLASGAAGIWLGRVLSQA